MRVLAACSLGGAGHLNPMLPFLVAAERRGDEVLVVGPPALEDMVRQAGFPFSAGGEPAEMEVAAIRERLPVAPHEEAAVLGNRELFGWLATSAMLPRMESICADWAPDLVLREPCEYASAVVAGEMGIGTAQVAISFAEGECASIDTAEPALEAHRKGLTDELRTAPYLTRFPASLDPSPFRSTLRYGDSVAASPIPDWWNGSDGPLIYVTFGTVLGYMSIAADVYRTALQAVAGLANARVLLTTGRRFDPASIGPIPATVHVEAWVDQGDVLAQADLVLCHGGSGTVLGALAAGVPLVVLPVFADQFENGRRVAEARVGVMVQGDQRTDAVRRRVIGEPDVARITQAVEAVRSDTGYRHAAARLASEMAAAPSVDARLTGLMTS
jgi:UDP:flavonoid glycosyltransferase YjiC (YdhE family)